MADAGEPPHPNPYQAKVPDADDIRRVLEVADQTVHRSLVRTLVYTGLRVGESLGLRWLDVDLENKVLYVRQTARRERGRGIVFSAGDGLGNADQPGLPERKRVDFGDDAYDSMPYRGLHKRREEDRPAPLPGALPAGTAADPQAWPECTQEAPM